MSQIDRGAAQARQAVDSIVANKPNLRLTDEAGNETAGVLPKSLKQFGEAVEQTKAQIFQRYDALARQAGEAGVAVDLAPAVSELRSIASDRTVRDLHPQLATYAADLAGRLAKSGSYTPSEAQSVIQNLNKSLSSFFANPTSETIARSSIEARLLGKLRRKLGRRDRECRARPAIRLCEPNTPRCARPRKTWRAPWPAMLEICPAASWRVLAISRPARKCCVVP